MPPRSSAVLCFAGAILFAVMAIYGFVSFDNSAIDIIQLSISFIFSLFCVILGLKYLKKIESFKFLEPYLVKDRNNEPIYPVDEAQLGIKKINHIALTPEQEKFVNHYSMSGSVLGILYYTLNGLTKEGLKQIIPVYGSWQNIKALNFGRKIVWENIAWKDFETYKKRQILLDFVAYFILLVQISVPVALLYYWVRISF